MESSTYEKKVQGVIPWTKNQVDESSGNQLLGLKRWNGKSESKKVESTHFVVLFIIFNYHFSFLTLFIR